MPQDIPACCAGVDKRVLMMMIAVVVHRRVPLAIVRVWVQRVCACVRVCVCARACALSLQAI